MGKLSRMQQRNGRFRQSLLFQFFFFTQTQLTAYFCLLCSPACHAKLDWSPECDIDLEIELPLPARKTSSNRDIDVSIDDITKQVSRRLSIDNISHEKHQLSRIVTYDSDSMSFSSIKERTKKETKERKRESLSGAARDKMKGSIPFSLLVDSDDSDSDSDSDNEWIMMSRTKTSAGSTRDPFTTAGKSVATRSSLSTFALSLTDSNSDDDSNKDWIISPIETPVTTQAIRFTKQHNISSVIDLDNDSDISSDEDSVNFKAQGTEEVIDLCSP